MIFQRSDIIDKLVYSSSDPQTHQKQKSGRKDKKTPDPFNCSGPIRVRMEKKGRGGKIVTVIDNLPMSKSEAKTLMKSLQKIFGCGASLKSGTIELQGDWRDKVTAHLPRGQGKK